MKLQPIRNSLGFGQELDGLVPPALVYVEQTELHQTVGHHVVVEPDLLLPEREREKQRLLLIADAVAMQFSSPGV